MSRPDRFVDRGEVIDCDRIRLFLILGSDQLMTFADLMLCNTRSDRLLDGMMMSIVPAELRGWGDLMFTPKTHLVAKRECEARSRALLEIVKCVGLG